MDNTNQNPVQETADLKVSSSVDAKVSTAEAQRKTAVAVQIIYSFSFLVVGIALAVWSIVWLSQMGLGGAKTGGMQGADVHGPISESNYNHSMFAMGIVGVILIVWGIASTGLAAAFQVTNKSKHHISDAMGIFAWFTLNPFSWSMIRQSNGYVSKKQKAKLAKKEAAANSDDSVDVKSDAAQAEEAQVQQIA